MYSLDWVYIEVPLAYILFTRFLFGSQDMNFVQSPFKSEILVVCIRLGIQEGMLAPRL